MMKHCNKCDTSKPLDEFPDNRKVKSGKDWKCKQCHRESWHMRKPARKFIPYELPSYYEITQDNLRRIFRINENGQLMWVVDYQPRARKGMVAGDSSLTDPVVTINGKRYKASYLISIYLTGEPVKRDQPKSKAQNAYERAWMREIKPPRFFDWSVLWAKEVARRRAKKASSEKYAAMTEDERRAEWRLRGARRCKKAKREYTARWKEGNPEKVKEYARRHNKNPKHRPKLNLRSRFKDLMNTVRKGGSMSFSKTIGCTTKQLSEHLESHFTKRMTWDNYGTYWHVDHVIPVSKFDHSDQKQVRHCWHWTNLKPLEAKKNIMKSGTITKPQMHLLLPRA